MRLTLFAILAILIGGLYFLLFDKEAPTQSEDSDQTRSQSHEPAKEKRKPSSLASSTLTEEGPSHREPDNAIPGERVVKFRSDDDYLNFLASLEKRGLTLLKRNDRFRTALVGYRSDRSFDGLDDADYSFNYPVSPPLPPNDASAQAGAVGFGGGVLNWLGISGDHSSWGKGILVAVIDTGVNSHDALSNEGRITRVDLSGSTTLSNIDHGTPVASLISGDHPLLSGVAPASDLLSIKVTDPDGFSDSFTLAEAILYAADNGADLINISMGSSGDSLIVEDALNYAYDQGIVTIAASGNEGAPTLNYPAAYDNAIAVGAVEAQGDHLDFSNSGQQLDITAPGFQIYAAHGQEESVISFSGTSGATPLVTGTIAALMSEHPELSAQQASDLVINYANEAGTAGQDLDYGHGVLNVDRAINYNTPDRHDPAIASQVPASLNAAGLPNSIDVIVENRGTEDLFNSTLTVNTAGQQQTYNIPHLEVGQVETVNVVAPEHTGSQSLSISSSIRNTSGDLNRADSSRSETFTIEN